jgi:transposase InsO family protein
MKPATRPWRDRRAPHPDKIRHFERAGPNQLWQTDLFTFVLKRQNRRLYLVAFMDDHSRFLVGYGLHASQSAALVLEVFRAGLASLRSAPGGADRQRQPVCHLAAQERLQ